MKRVLQSLIFNVILIVGFTQAGNAQVYDPTRGCVVGPDGKCLPNTVVTAMPFLTIAPDARGGGMGDVGIATTPSINSLAYNASNLAFLEKDFELSLTYTPWLRDLNLNDIYLLYLNGVYKIDEFQTISASYRYFSIGEIPFTGTSGEELGLGMPREGEFAVAYSRKLGDNFAAALTGKYLFSNIASGQQINGIDITTASAIAADVSLTYKSDMQLGEMDAAMTYGLSLRNIGSKVSYSEDGSNEDFIPTTFGLGAGMELNIDEYNRFNFGLDLTKLMIPSPISKRIVNENGELVDNPDYDTDESGIADYREKGLFEGMFGSFADAQGGFKEELKEINIGFGVEYWYNNQFAARAGYFYEHPEKGGRNFLTIGLGLMYNKFGIDLSYLVPTNNRRTPLDNTLRFGLSLDLSDGGLDNMVNN